MDSLDSQKVIDVAKLSGLFSTGDSPAGAWGVDPLCGEHPLSSAGGVNQWGPPVDQGITIAVESWRKLVKLGISNDEQLGEFQQFEQKSVD
jgi:hypothetical protein